MRLPILFRTWQKTLDFDYSNFLSSWTKIIKITHLLSYANTVLCCSYCKIQRYVAAPVPDSWANVLHTLHKGQVTIINTSVWLRSKILNKWKAQQFYSSQIRQRDLHKIYIHCYSGQRFFAATYRTVHFLSSICSECILCWSSCRGLILRRLRQGNVPPHPPPYM